MIIHDTSTPPDYRNKIEERIGLSLQEQSNLFFIEKMQMDWPGFRSFKIDSAYAKIQLHENGVVAACSDGENQFFWVVPFYHLTIYSTDQFSMYGNEEMIRFKNAKINQENKRFIYRLIEAKAEFSRIRIRFSGTDF